MKRSFVLMSMAMCVITAPAIAADSLKLAVGQRGNWDTAVSELGNRAGIFKKHGLELDILYTQGGGETQQAVLSGSVDIGAAVGTLGVFASFAKGAPLRIIAAESTGASEYWYVPANSKLQKLQDATAENTIAYSTNGSSTNSVVLGLIDEYKLTLKPVATGSAPATYTPVMSGQIDIGWASPPFGFNDLKAGKIRILARSSDVAAIRGQSIRVTIANARAVEQKKDQVARYVAAYRETLDWMYSSEDALKSYAAFAETDVETAKRMRDEFAPKAMMDPDKVSGIDLLMADAIRFKAIPAPLTPDQLSKLIQIPARQ